MDLDVEQLVKQIVIAIQNRSAKITKSRGPHDTTVFEGVLPDRSTVMAIGKRDADGYVAECVYTNTADFMIVRIPPASAVRIFDLALKITG